MGGRFPTYADLVPKRHSRWQTVGSWKRPVSLFLLLAVLLSPHAALCAERTLRMKCEQVVGSFAVAPTVLKEHLPPEFREMNGQCLSPEDVEGTFILQARDSKLGKAFGKIIKGTSARTFRNDCALSF